jgi:predicted nucleic acid-binding protein
VRVVVDTSVLLQVVTGAGLGASPIYRAWQARRFALLTSETQLEELAGGDVETEWGDDE